MELGQFGDAISCIVSPTQCILKMAQTAGGRARCKARPRQAFLRGLSADGFGASVIAFSPRETTTFCSSCGWRAIWSALHSETLPVSARLSQPRDLRVTLGFRRPRHPV